MGRISVRIIFDGYLTAFSDIRPKKDSAPPSTYIDSFIDPSQGLHIFKSKLTTNFAFLGIIREICGNVKDLFAVLQKPKESLIHLNIASCDIFQFCKKGGGHRHVTPPPEFLVEVYYPLPAGKSDSVTNGILRKT